MAQVDLNQVRAKIKVPANLQSALQRIELAGKKVMYSKETHGMVMEAMQGEGAWEEKLGRGIADLMALLFQQSNKSMPPQLIVPAAVLLMCDAIEFLQQSGQVPQIDVGAAMEATIVMTLHKFGMKPDQIKAAIDQYGKGGLINSRTNPGQQVPQGPGPAVAPQPGAMPQPGAAQGV